MSQEFRLKNIGKTRNYFLEEMEQDEVMSRKHKKVCTACISVSAFAFLVGMAIVI